MKIKDVLYQTPEMSEERLISIINKYIKYIPKCLQDRINSIHKDNNLAKSILDEWDLIQIKSSYLSKKERDLVSTLVSASLIEMVKNNEQVEEKA